MSVTRLSDGRWVCRYPKGKDKTRPATNKKYFGRGDDAELAARTFNSKIGLGSGSKNTKTPKKSQVFVALSNEYLKAKQNSMTSSTFDDACIRLENIILPYFGHLQIHEITHQKLDSYVLQRKKKVKQTTIRNDLATIRAILNFSVKRNIIINNPMAGYELPKKDNTRLLPPNDNEVEAIIKCASPHIKRAVLLTYHTGVRPGKVELLSLTWEAVDFANRLIMITSAAKGGLPIRMVPMSKTIGVKLEKWYEEDLEKGAKYIINYNGYHIDSIRKAWDAAKRRAKITRRIRLYDLRHAFITRLLERGADLKSVSEIAGHSSPDITMSVYQHVSSNLKRQAIDLLD